jgi:hypothetical protein
MTLPRALVVFALIASCNEEASKFPVVIVTQSDDGRALPDLPVTLGKTPAGRTDADGRLKMRVAGKEGQKIAVTVGVPKGYKISGTAAPLVLRRLVDIESGSSRALPIEHVVKLAPLERRYAVLVRTGVAGLPIETFGTRRAVTNDKGVAMFLYDGAPGDELQVKLDTSSHPELRPQNPTENFLLAQRSEAYVVKQHFATYKAPVKHHKPVHLGPKRL